MIPRHAHPVRRGTEPELEPGRLRGLIDTLRELVGAEADTLTGRLWQ